MIYWQGKKYCLTKSEYNGPVLGYLLDGILIEGKKKGTVIRGHFSTESGVIIVLKRSVFVLWCVFVILIVILIIALWPQYEYHYYPVSFCETPVFMKDTLYCNVRNDAETAVTVQFLNDFNASSTYTLQPGESLPYILLDFIPAVIRYNGNYDFQLEVQSD